MRTLHKPTRILITFLALAMLSLAAFAGADPTDPGISDQKAGTMLVFPYYTSVGTGTAEDTRFSITNVGMAPVNVHIILIDSSTCTQLDYYDCITPNGSLVDKASNLDPGVTGYMIVLQVNGMTGLPAGPNRLIGNAFVKDILNGTTYEGNYGAEAFSSTVPAMGTPEMTLGTPVPGKTDALAITLKVPCEFAVEIQNPGDADQRIVVAGLSGDISNPVLDINGKNTLLTGAGQVGTGQIFDKDENGVSVQKLLTGTCFAENTITATSIRGVTSKLLPGLLVSGGAGYMRFSIGGGVGLIMTAPKGTNFTKGIRTLHKTKTTTATLTVPVFMPGVGACTALSAPTPI